MINDYPDLIPSFEHERLEALQPYQVLGTPGQGLFNDFVSVVARLFDAPIALVSLVRAADVVFIGNAGLPGAPIVDRTDSMCSVAILQDGLTVFEDLATQPCLLVNPFAAQQMQLRFYAGQALRTPAGQPIGSLCVLDRRPRRLSPAEGELLTQLALVAQDLLELQVRPNASAAALRERLDGPLTESLTRLGTLAGLTAFEPDPDTATARRLAADSLAEAQYLAQVLHRRLQALLVGA